MSVFNPAVQPTQPQDVTRNQPINTPDFRSTVGSAFKSAGDIFESAVKGADQVISTLAKNAVANEAQPLVDKRTEDLRVADALLKGSAANSGTAPAQSTESTAELRAPPMDLMAGPGQAMPADISNIRRDAGALKDARASGRLSETDYKGRIDSLAKDIRSRYPSAYRPVIDEEFKAITGEAHTAQSYQQSLTADINAVLTNANAEKNRVLGKMENLMGLDPIGMPVMYSRLRAGQETPDSVMRYLAPLEARKYNLEIKEMQVKAYKGENEVMKLHYEDLANQTGNTYMLNTVDAMLNIAGVKSMRELENLIIDIGAGKRPPLSSEDSIKVAQLAAAHGQVWRQKTEDAYRKNGVFDILGPKKSNELLKEGSDYFDQIRDGFAKGNLDMAMNGLRIVQARESDASKALSDSPMGKTLNKWEALKKAAGPTLADTFMAGIVKSSIEKGFVNYLQETAADLLVPDVRERKVESLKPALEHVIQFGSKTPTGAVDVPKAVHNLLGLVDNLLKKDTPDAIKDQLVKMAFNPDNRGLLSLVSPEIKDEKGKIIAPGQLTLWERFTNQDFVDEVKKVGARNPQALAWYNDWIKTTFAQDVAKPALMRLKDINPNDPDLGYKLRWDTATHNLYVDYKGTSYDEAVRRTAGKRGQAPGVRSMVDDLNRSLTGLVHAAEADPKNNKDSDIDKFVLETILDETGPNFDATKIEGMPREIMLKIVAARMKEQIDQSNSSAERAKYKPKK